MNFEENLNSVKSEDLGIKVDNDEIIKTKTKRVYKDKIYTFLVKKEDEEKIEKLITDKNMAAGEFFREAIAKAFDVKFTGNYKNTGRRGKK